MADYVRLTQDRICANRADRHQSWTGLVPTVTSHSVFSDTASDLWGLYIKKEWVDF